MDAQAHIPAWAYRLMLVTTTIIWGYSYTVMKAVIETVPCAWLVGLRCLAAGVLLGVVLWKRVVQHFSPRLLGAGIVLGAFDFCGAYFQAIGLVHTTPGISAFLTATYCIIVPFAWWAIARRRPSVFHVGAAVLAIAGIWLVSAAGETFGLGFGEGMTLACALMYALHMVLVSKFSARHDVIVLTVVQFLTEGAIGCLIGGASGAPLALSAFTPVIVGQFVFLTLLGTIACFLMQNISLAHVPPAQASLLLSLESVFGVLFSVLLYGERLTSRLIVGFVLIFAAIVISETLPPKRHARE